MLVCLHALLLGRRAGGVGSAILPGRGADGCPVYPSLAALSGAWGSRACLSGGVSPGKHEGPQEVTLRARKMWPA